MMKITKKKAKKGGKKIAMGSVKNFHLSKGKKGKIAKRMGTKGY